MNRTATSVVRLRRMTAKGCSVRCDIWRSFHDYPLPRRKARFIAFGKPAHRVERLQRQAPAMRLVSTVTVLVLTSALHQPRSPWHQDAKVISPWDGTIVRGSSGQPLLGSEIGITNEGCRVPSAGPLG